MTIKSKLIANMLVTMAIIALISLAGFSSLRHLQDRLSFIAEKSTPFQMGTVEFQRELQNCATGLVKTSAARDLNEYRKFRAESESSLENAGKLQKQLAAFSNGEQIETVLELKMVAGELFTATEARIASSNEAHEAETRVLKLKSEASDRLKDLETNIRKLQITHAAAFKMALDNTTHFSAKLHALENLRNLITELISVTGTVLNSTTNKSFMIARGKTKMLLARIAGNKNHDFTSPDLTTLNDDVNEFLKLHAIAISNKDSESIRWSTESLHDLYESLNRLNLSLNQEIELASAKLAIETLRQEDIYAKSSKANDILVGNSELTTLSHTVSGMISRLFTLESTTELDRHASEIRTIFSALHTNAGTLEKSVANLDAKNELKTVKMARASLEAIRAELFTSGGLIDKLTKKFDASERAGLANDKLRDLVATQSAKGKENVTVAREEQTKSLVEINRLVEKSITGIAVIDLAAAAVGLFFGWLIYRSITKPLKMVLNAVNDQKKRVSDTAGLAKVIASGDLGHEVKIREPLQLDLTQLNKDEMHKLLSGVVEMSGAQLTLDHAFAEMAVSLRNNRDSEAKRDHLNNGLFGLNLILREEQGIVRLSERALAFIAEFLEARVGIMYSYIDAEERLQAIASYALPKTDKSLRLGEGLPGQAALDKKILILETVPPGYLPITSALGKADPLNIIIIPVMHNDSLSGVLELGSFRLFGEDDLEFLKPALEGVAIALNANRSRQLVNELLELSQQQSEELRAGQEELLQTNEELVETARLIAGQKQAAAETL